MPKQERILKRTSNFFSLYTHISGITEIPKIYHFWCCVALISAALEDRVWFELYKDVPTKPNLYVGLIGPGSVGKGLAISQAVALVEKSLNVTVYRGKVTFAHLIDRLGKPSIDDWGREVIANPKLWLVMDEFKNAVGSNKSLSEELVALMTELYTATNYTMQSGTRSAGEVAIKNACLNWIFGSNEGWLRQVLTKEIFESGFVARGCFIFADEDLDNLVSRPIYPFDYEEVYEHLKLRLWMMQGYKGRFLITPTAEATLDQWYHNRAKPEDESLYSTWRRQREMLLRFAMILCIAEGGQMVICDRHLSQAAYMVKLLARFTSRLLMGANESYNTRPVNIVGEYIKRKKEIDHTRLLRYMRAKRGFDAATVKKAVSDLIQERSVTMDLSPTGGQLYFWV